MQRTERSAKDRSLKHKNLKQIPIKPNRVLRPRKNCSNIIQKTKLSTISNKSSKRTKNKSSLKINKKRKISIVKPKSSKRNSQNDINKSTSLQLKNGAKALNKISKNKNKRLKSTKNSKNVSIKKSMIKSKSSKSSKIKSKIKSLKSNELSSKSLKNSSNDINIKEEAILNRSKSPKKSANIINENDENVAPNGNLLIKSFKNASQKPFQDRLFQQISSTNSENEEENTIKTKYESEEMFSEYSLQILEYIKSIETIPSSITTIHLQNQTEINSSMRSILIDWLIDVNLKFKLKLDSFFLSISILDRFLSLKTVQRSRFQLLGGASMLLATKVEEVYPPVLEDFVYVADGAYSRDELVEMEISIALTLNWSFTFPTPLHFLNYFLQQTKASSTQKHFCNMILELFSLEMESNLFLPSKIAASAVSIAMFGLIPVDERSKLGSFGVFWNTNFQQITNYNFNDLFDCISAIKTILKTANPNEHAIRKKYESDSFDSVSFKIGDVCETIIKVF